MLPTFVETTMEAKMVYHYFISYLFQNKTFSPLPLTCYGNMEVTLDFQISSIDDIHVIEKRIQDKSKLKNVCILNYQLFKTESLA